jgi:hypothetical protein
LDSRCHAAGIKKSRKHHVLSVRKGLYSPVAACGEWAT